MRRRLRAACFLLICGPMLAALLALGLSTTVSASEPPLRVFIRAGVKTHGPGQHDHPRFLDEWKVLLSARGAKTEGALRFPTAEELGRTDVLVIYAQDGGTVAPDERMRLATFLGRGGGVVVLHDGIVSDDPTWWAGVVGGAFQKGRSKFHEGKVGLYFGDPHPTTQGIASHFLQDEIYWDMVLSPQAKVLATGFRTVQEITPQVWVFEKDRYRAFVSLLGHNHTSFALPQHRAMLLRGIAWAARRSVDTLVSREELGSLRYPSGGPIPPSKAAQTMVVDPEFDLSLVAAEPDVVKPISIDWDAAGRLWVAQAAGYPEKAGRDSVVVLEQGKRRVFCDKLDLLTSFVFYKDGVIVATPPDIQWLRDTDGDGRCDRREVLFTGFGIRDTHATVSNLRWGMDGWIYGDQGYSGRQSQVSGAGGRKFGDIGNGVFRFRADASAIELVASVSGNTWGIDFRWDGELFFSMANGSHLRHVVLPEAVLARGKIARTQSWKEAVDHREVNPLVEQSLNPYVQIDHVGGFTAASGGTVYGGGAWPASWNDAHFLSEPTVNLIHHDRLRSEGPSFSASRVKKDELVTSRDLWFRPVETRVGPDGALYVADFYNLAAVHNDTRGPPHDRFNAAIRPDRDHEHGRIWRLQHKQASPAAVPRLEGASEAELTGALEHPNRWVRMTAHRLIAERGPVRLATNLRTPAARVHALWLMAGRLEAGQIAAALGDADAAVRKTAAMVAAESPSPAVSAALGKALDDADARVRLQSLAALGKAPPSPAITATLVRTFPTLNDDWSRSAAVGAAARAPIEAIAAALKTGGEGTLPLVEALAASVGKAKAAELITRVAAASAASLQAAALGALARSLPPDAALRAAVAPSLGKLLASSDLRVASAALPLAARVQGTALVARSRALAARLARTLSEPGSDDATRARFFRALLAVAAERPRALTAAAQLLGPSSSAALQTQVIEALGDSAEPQTASVLVSAFPRLGGPARQVATAQLLKRPNWSLALVTEIEAGRLRPQDLGPAALFRLRNHPNRSVGARATGVIDGIMGAAAKEKDQVIAQLLPAVQQPGDRGKGRDLFTANCLVCHTFKGQGRNVAPDLTGMGARGPAELLVHVVDPNRALEPNFVAFDITTANGTVQNGVIGRETAEAVLLRNAAGEVEIKRADIKTMVSSGLSLMPEGFEALGPEAMRDMLAYICFDDGRYRTLDLRSLATANHRQLFGEGSDRWEGELRLTKLGAFNLDGTPFQIPEGQGPGNDRNVLVLGSGTRVEVPLGFSFEALEVLGGIARHAATEPGKPTTPIVKVTYHYTGGETEQAFLRDGVEFADWSRRIDVPGSRFVAGLVPDGVRGQVRRFTLRPTRRAPIARLTLEAVDDRRPVFLAMTADLGAQAKAAPSSSRVLVVGGGASHDFNRWFRDADLAALGEGRYIDKPAEILPGLSSTDVLVLTANQPLTDPALRKGLLDFVAAGKGLVVMHPAAWYNWKDWPEYNQLLVGGGARGHEKYGEFDVTIVDKTHAVTKSAPVTFSLPDELYRFEKTGDIHPLAVGKSRTSGAEYPVAWTLTHGKGRIAVITLGHDGGAHDHAGYKALLRNAVGWVKQK